MEVQREKKLFGDTKKEFNLFNITVTEEVIIMTPVLSVLQNLG